MRKFFRGNLFPFLLILINTSCKSHKAVESAPGYELVNNWPQRQQGLGLGQVTGIGVDSLQNIFLFHRAGREWTEPFPDSRISSNTILMLGNETGSVKNSWGANQFIMPHGLTVDRENNIWVTDVALHQVFKFSHEGKLLLELGIAKTPGKDSLHFNLPTDVAVANDGSFYVSDGYGNSRIARFSKEGKFLYDWGKRGDNPGEFHTPHGIDLDKAGNVYVADRDNNRIQIFDSSGNFITQWENDQAEQVYSLTIEKSNNRLFAIDYVTIAKLIPKGSDIIQFDAAIHVASRMGRSGNYDGPVSRYHDIATDRKGNIYLADILGNNIYKFRKQNP